MLYAGFCKHANRLKLVTAQLKRAEQQKEEFAIKCETLANEVESLKAARWAMVMSEWVAIMTTTRTAVHHKPQTELMGGCNKVS
jgi:hypothetical protein